MGNDGPAGTGRPASAARRLAVMIHALLGFLAGRRSQWLTAALVVAVASLAWACSERGQATPTPPSSPTTPPGASVTPGAPPGERPERKQAVTDSPLHDGRLDLAARLGVDPLEVRFRDARAAAWDGCLGIVYEGEPCLELLVAGYVAFYEVEAGGRPPYRYHFGGGHYVAVDFYDGAISDGIPVPPELRVDFHALLAAYARHDLALRLDSDADRIIVIAIVPIQFPDGCMGFRRPGDIACTDAIVPGAVVLLEASDGKRFRYHVADQGFIPVDFEDGEVTQEPDPQMLAMQEAIRRDLADRLGAPLATISFVAFREVTWGDGCLGVHRPGELCTQVLVEGFFALLRDANGTEYRYHGSADRFIAASFEPADVRIDDPLPPEE
ncbi:MAG: hypothetical protein Kow0010_24540 [Dehalococcoidia bacterium]